MNLRERDVVQQALELLEQVVAGVRVEQVKDMLSRLIQQPGEDPLPPGWNRPAPATEEELARVLKDVLRAVEEGDSAEGFVEWLMPQPDPCEECDGRGWRAAEGTIGGWADAQADKPGSRRACEPCGGTGESWQHQEQLKGAEFGVRARWRIGTSMGQGGMRAFVKEVGP